MKLNNSYLIHFCGGKKQETKKEETQTASKKPIEANACECQSAYNIAMIKSKDNSDIYFENAMKVAEKIIEEDEHIKRKHIDKRDGEIIVRFQAGKEVEGFKDLYYDNIRVACYFDNEKEINKIFKWNQNTGEVFVYDKDGNQTHYYSKEDIDALHFYKYHPDSIHTKLREGKDDWNDSWNRASDKSANSIANMFNDESKVFRTTETKTLYRALQSRLTNEQMEALSTIGGIYTDPSFASTTENLDVAKRFSHGNPILKINVPKDTKYMDVERLFNIDDRNWREKELLLNRNSSFLVTGYDQENNIIEVDYIG